MFILLAEKNASTLLLCLRFRLLLLVWLLSSRRLIARWLVTRLLVSLCLCFGVSRVVLCLSLLVLFLCELELLLRDLDWVSYDLSSKSQETLMESGEVLDVVEPALESPYHLM